MFNGIQRRIRPIYWPDKKGGGGTWDVGTIINPMERQTMATMRKDSSENGKFNSGTIDIENPILGFLAGLQPEILERFAKGKNQDSGLVGRFNVFFPKDAKKKPGKIATKEEEEEVNERQQK